MIEYLIILVIVTMIWVFVSSKYLILEYKSEYTPSRVTPTLPKFDLPVGVDTVKYLSETTLKKYGYFPYYQSFNESDNYSFISVNYKMNYKIESNRVDSSCLLIGLMAITSNGYLHNTLSSLINTGYKGKIVIFVDICYESIENNIFNASIIRLRRKYPYYPYNDSNYNIEESEIREMIPDFPRSHKYFWNIIRIYLVRLFLKHFGNTFSYIHFCDLKDVLFQINPFHWNYQQKAVYLFEETRRFNISHNYYSNKWISVLNPPKSLLLNPNINSGNIFGSFPEIYYFFSELIEFMNGIKYDIMKYSTEQGVLNVFYYLHTPFELLSYSVYFSRNERGMVRNFAQDLAAFPNESFPNNNNLIENLDCRLPCILHQYLTGSWIEPKERRMKFGELINTLVNKHVLFDNYSY